MRRRLCVVRLNCYQERAGAKTLETTLFLAQQSSFVSSQRPLGYIALQYIIEELLGL